MWRDPDGRPSLRASRWFGVALILASIPAGYYLLVSPLQSALRTGSGSTSFKAVLLVPMMLYLGIAIQVTDLRDGSLREQGPNGRLQYTRKGKVVIGGFVALELITIALWYLTLHVLGLQESV